MTPEDAPGDPGGPGATGPEVVELVGVYHADGGIVGELRYAAGRLLGRTHCALCDVTHSGVRRRPEWDRMAAGLPVPVRLVHLNERDARERVASPLTPCVLARTGDGLVEVLGPDDLDGLGGSVEAFADALGPALTARGLVLP